jgi:hypothetical protein
MYTAWFLWWTFQIIEVKQGYKWDTIAWLPSVYAFFSLISFMLWPFQQYNCVCFWNELLTVLGGVDGNLHFPVPSMKRLNQTEPATFSIVSCWLSLGILIFYILHWWLWMTCWFNYVLVTLHRSITPPCMLAELRGVEIEGTKITWQ